jgi:apolipoprotein N-acyltransferase
LPYARKLKVGLIQSNFEPFDHEKIGSNVMLKRYVDLSHIAAKKGAEWIVWSEGEFKWALSTSIAANLLKDVAKSVGRPILLGGHDAKYQDKRWLYYNSAIHVHPEQGLGQRYDKLILVPFGEYMPYEKQLNFIYRKISWYSRYSPGDKTQIQELDGIPYGFLICYEAIYPRRVRRSVNDGAKLLVNITYDAWFGRSTAPYQHLMLAATRSAEFGVPLVRLATTGSSTVVNALGKTDKLSPIFEEQVLIYELPLVQLPSLYAKIGDIFAWLCLIFSLLAIGFLWIKPKRVLRTE